jgi:hypothetical protein
MHRPNKSALGIAVEVENKWITLIQNASKNTIP